MGDEYDEDFEVSWLGPCIVPSNIQDITQVHAMDK
jgi:hypothetical protein